MNRPCINTKLAAGLIGILLAGFSLPAQAQTVPSDATVVQRMATQNPAPLPHRGFFGSDYGLLNQGRSGQELTLTYLNSGKNRKTAPYSLLSSPRMSLFVQIEADQVNRRNAIFGSTTWPIANERMQDDGITPHFRPLLEIPLGANKLPLFLYVPNPQANLLSW